MIEVPPAILRRTARLLRSLPGPPGQPDCLHWEAAMDGEPDGAGAVRAVSYPSLTGELAPGDRVLLNATAVALGLGTGGAHFVIASLEGAGGPPEPFPGRSAGHILKLRYTPLQRRVRSGEEEASPYRNAVLSFRSLEGTPVLGAELLSQAAAAAIAAHAHGAAVGRVPCIAMVLLDTAALPLAFSGLIARLRCDGVVAGCITTGQAFGGDVEAVNVYSGLVLARAALHADLIIVTQGPGNVGTGTRFGFGGLALAEAFHAGDTLGGRAVLVPRLSEADPRARHRGLSHHTQTLLDVTRAPLVLPRPPEVELELPESRWPREAPRVDPAPAWEALAPFRDVLTTMGRTLDEDPLYFRAAAAAGVYTAHETPPDR